MTFDRLQARGLVFFSALTFILSGCMNLTGIIDKPRGDGQKLSAARAAFDRGDLDKARELYGELGGSEVAISETVFLDLDTCGADIGAFGAALGAASGATSNPGVLITVMAEKMNARHGTDCLATLLAAYKTSQNSITDPSLKGFTGFLAAIAIAGEVLAHNNGITTDGELSKADFLNNTAPTSCTVASCNNSCAPAGDGVTAQVTVTLTSAGSISATWGAFHGAVQAANTNLTTLGVSSGASFSLMASLASGTPAVDKAYRCLLNDVGVGR